MAKNDRVFGARQPINELMRLQRMTPVSADRIEIELCVCHIWIACLRPAKVADRQTARCGSSVELEFELPVVATPLSSAAPQRHDFPVVELENALHIAVENFAVRRRYLQTEWVIAHSRELATDLLP